MKVLSHASGLTRESYLCSSCAISNDEEKANLRLYEPFNQMLSSRQVHHADCRIPPFIYIEAIWGLL